MKKEAVVPPPDTVAGHPDKVVPGSADAHDCADPVPALCSWVLDTDYILKNQRLEGSGVSVVPKCGISETRGSLKVTALRPRLSLFLEGFGMCRDAGAERVTIIIKSGLRGGQCG